MSGNWIKVEKITPQKPEIAQLASVLNVSPNEAFGLCFRFWSWCDDNLTSGEDIGITADMLDTLIGRKGFAQGLIDVGWLIIRKGSLKVSNFDRHLSKSAKKRSLSQERTANSRADKCNARSVTKSLPEKTRKEKILSAPTEHLEILDYWSKSLGVNCSLTQARTNRLTNLLKDPKWARSWRVAVDKVAQSNFCRGSNERGWKANLDWFLRPDTVTKIMEGMYDNREERKENSLYEQYQVM